MPSFDRAALLVATEKAMEVHRTNWHAERLVRVRVYVDELNAWLDKHGDTWAKLGRLIARRMRKGEPIRSSDLPAGRFDLPTFTRADPTDESYPEPHALATLAEVLRVLADEKVSVAALRDLGVDPHTLRQALQFLPAGRR